MDKLHIIKIGGNVIDDDQALSGFLQDFATIQGHKLLIHGGGKLATDMASRLQIPQKMIEGRRITDSETLQVITMVYGGLINKKIVSLLQAYHCNAIGLTGADGNAILAHKRNHPTIDYGFAGDIDSVNHMLIGQLLEAGLVPVFAPITHDRSGQLLNTNADTIAREIAVALADKYETTLAYTFEKPGVLADSNNDSSVISSLTRTEFEILRSEKKVHSGMIPKLDNAFNAAEGGVSVVVIGDASKLQQLITGKAGTRLMNG